MTLQRRAYVEKEGEERLSGLAEEQGFKSFPQL